MMNTKFRELNQQTTLLNRICNKERHEIKEMVSLKNWL